jgi:hypothetical protein
VSQTDLAAAAQQLGDAFASLAQAYRAYGRALAGPVAELIPDAGDGSPSLRVKPTGNVFAAEVSKPKAYWCRDCNSQIPGWHIKGCAFEVSDLPPCACRKCRRDRGEL